MPKKRVSRLRLVGLSRWSVIAWSLLPSALLFLLLTWINTPFDRAIGLSGFAMAVLSLVLTQFQAQGPRRRHVHFVGQTDRPFAVSIEEGLRSTLEPSSHIVYHRQRTLRGNELEVLSRLDRPDGIVIWPLVHSPELWRQLARLARRGTYVVVVDILPDYQVFESLRAPSPVFISSDFPAGGALLGSRISGLLETDQEALVLAAKPPGELASGSERFLTLVDSLSAYNDRVRLIEMGDWGDEGLARTAALIAREARQIMESAQPPPRLIVVCPNDQVLVLTFEILWAAPELYRSQDPGDKRPTILLIGYDGALDAAGRHIADKPLSLGTVDTRPEEQGRLAAQALLDEMYGVRAESVHLVAPTWIGLKAN